jgi:hypothetical protein
MNKLIGMAENPKPMAACESRDKERDLVAEIERSRERERERERAWKSQHKGAWKIKDERTNQEDFENVAAMTLLNIWEFLVYLVDTTSRVASKGAGLAVAREGDLSLI